MGWKRVGATMSTGAMGGLIGGLSSNPWTLPVGIGLGVFGGLMANRQKTLPPPKAIFPGAQEGYMQGLTTGTPNNMFGQGGVPGLGPTSMSELTKLIMGGGMASNYMPNVEAITSAMGRQQAQGRNNLIEKYGSKGLRFSQPLLQAGQDYEGQVAKDYGSLLSNFAYQSQESAMQRLMQGLGMGTSLYGNAGMSMYQSKTSPGAGAVSGIATGVGDVLQTISLMKMMGLH